MCAFPAAQSHVGAEHDLSSHEESESFAKSLRPVAEVQIPVGKRDLSGIIEQKDSHRALDSSIEFFLHQERVGTAESIIFESP